MHVDEDGEKEEYSPLLVELQTGMTILEINLEVPQKVTEIYLKTQLYHSWAYTQKLSHHATGAHVPVCSQWPYL